MQRESEPKEEIRAGDVGWSTLYPEADWPEDFLDASKARLDEVIEDVGTKTLRYIYDFGDGWEHAIKIERLLDPQPGAAVQRFIRAVDDAGGADEINAASVFADRSAAYHGDRWRTLAGLVVGGNDVAVDVHAHDRSKPFEFERLQFAGSKIDFDIVSR